MMTRLATILLCLFFTAPGAWGQGIGFADCHRPTGGEAAVESILDGCCSQPVASTLPARDLDVDSDGDAPLPLCPPHSDCEDALACCAKTLVDMPRLAGLDPVARDTCRPLVANLTARGSAHLDRLQRPPKA